MQYTKKMAKRPIHCKETDEKHVFFAPKPNGKETKKHNAIVNGAEAIIRQRNTLKYIDFSCTIQQEIEEEKKRMLSQGNEAVHRHLDSPCKERIWEGGRIMAKK